MNGSRTTRVGLLAVLCLAGCATSAPTVDKREVAVAAPVPRAEERMAAPRPPVEDRDLFLEGGALLHLPGEPDPAKARAVFASLVQRYPESRWRPAAEGFIRLIDESRALREAGRAEQLRQEQLRAEIAATLQENQSLKKMIRELKERLQTETAALSQENERLKKDLQRLKALEIELEKRERMLR